VATKLVLDVHSDPLVVHNVFEVGCDVLISILLQRFIFPPPLVLEGTFLID